MFVLILRLFPMELINIFSLKVNNPRAHELTTGPEIINSIISAPSTASRPSSERVDVFVAGAGTGSTITGVSRAIKKASNPTETHDLTKAHDPKCVVVGVDPVSVVPTNSRILIYRYHRKEAFLLSPILSIRLTKE